MTSRLNQQNGKHRHYRLFLFDQLDYKPQTVVPNPGSDLPTATSWEIDDTRLKGRSVNTLDPTMNRWCGRIEPLSRYCQITFNISPPPKHDPSRAVPQGLTNHAAAGRERSPEDAVAVVSSIAELTRRRVAIGKSNWTGHFELLRLHERGQNKQHRAAEKYC
jgi:hypothetical protein